VAVIIALAPTFAVSQTDNQGAGQNNNRPSATSRHRSEITGCLAGSDPDHYLLKDQNGVTNMVYSTTVHLDSYVGQSVTLVGFQSATPSTDTGTARPMPHFNVLEVHPGSGNCK
jgi:hypothetical protein